MIYRYENILKYPLARNLNIYVDICVDVLFIYYLHLHPGYFDPQFSFYCFYLFCFFKLMAGLHELTM